MHKIYPSFLFLEDGKKCSGWSFSSDIVSIGEIVFNTGMTGYQEICTDPSYSKQIVMFTYPEIGNTGINYEDNESTYFHVQGIIARSICLQPSNWRSRISLVQYLLNNKIPHIFGIDTRFLTSYIRDKGVMNACISTQRLSVYDLHEQFSNYNKIIDLDLVSQVTTLETYNWTKNSSNFSFYLFDLVNIKKNIELNVVVLDFGLKFNILNKLYSYGCNIIVVSSNSSYEDILKHSPDGILLSNGPGDPSVLFFAIETVKKLININIPLFGICMGHQILSLALGASTFKLKFGHRGLNHPVGPFQYKKVDLTSQNHGFSVHADSLPQDMVDLVYLNCNDNTLAGIVHNNKPIFSVQYHPEASPGPHDADYLFSHFINVMKKFKLNCI
uniref:Carbamoyl phosphate synthase small chain n=1 Tax=Sporolithon durum TaxID=48970 RepID=A0A141SD17_9FLOR|nr:carbamoyl-phosphate synthase arginine-specific small subunit [Sporolithon durum]AMK96185.1 carbamoyl-phosphate synthase arginine-specific small subunit [Sporolithon durum]